MLLRHQPRPRASRLLCCVQSRCPSTGQLGRWWGTQAPTMGCLRILAAGIYTLLREQQPPGRQRRCLRAWSRFESNSNLHQVWHSTITVVNINMYAARLADSRQSCSAPRPALFWIVLVSSLQQLPELDAAQCVVMFPSDDALLPDQIPLEQLKHVIIIDSKWSVNGLWSVVVQCTSNSYFRHRLRCLMRACNVVAQHFKAGCTLHGRGK